MTDIEKLRVLLPHWIDHNHSHEEEIEKWVKTLREHGEQDASDLIEKAMLSLKQADEAMTAALEKIGGPVKGHEHHHHT